MTFGFSHLKKDPRFLIPDYSNSTIVGLKEAVSLLDFDQPVSFDNPVSNMSMKQVRNMKNPGIKSLVIVLVDSLGLENIRETGFFSRFEANMLELDTCFPTVTSAAMASLSHVTFPSRHSLVGYNIWHEKVDNLVNTLNMQTRDLENGKPIDIEQLGLSKQDMITTPSLVSMLREAAARGDQSITIEILLPASFNQQGIGKYLFPTLDPIPYSDHDIVSTAKAVSSLIHNQKEDLGVYTIYIPHADHASHAFGRTSKQYYESLQMVRLLMDELIQIEPIKQDEAAMVLTSDHGQLDLPEKGSPNRITVSEAEAREHRKEGFVIGTSGRSLHVYHSENAQDRVNQFLEQLGLFGDNGITLSSKEALSLLGPEVKKSSITRFGNKIVLFSDDFYLDYPTIVPFGDDHDLKAQHGGLSPTEVKVPFFIY